MLPSLRLRNLRSTPPSAFFSVTLTPWSMLIVFGIKWRIVSVSSFEMTLSNVPPSGALARRLYGAAVHAHRETAMQTTRSFMQFMVRVAQEQQTAIGAGSWRESHPLLGTELPPTHLLQRTLRGGSDGHRGAPTSEPRPKTLSRY